MFSSFALTARAVPFHFIGVDTGMTTVIRQQLSKQQKKQYYPLSVARFYRLLGYKLAWIAPDTVKMHAGDAMILLDCVNQYGLNHTAYHPEKLTYTQLELLTTHNTQVSSLQKAQFDMWLTDALIAFINNLHFGRLNPDYSRQKIDAGVGDFDAASVLKAALLSPDFTKAITDVQPQSKAYRDFRHQLYLQTGLFVGDCYEFPEAGIRLMAINMERLRWYSIRRKTQVELNIPSLTLTIHEPDSNYYLRIKADQASLAALVKRAHNRSVVNVSVRGDKIVFLLSPAPNKSKQELPVKFLGNDDNRTSRTGNIIIWGSSKLIAKLFAGQTNKQKLIRQGLNITYLTCSLKDGELIRYNDLFKIDKGLESALY
jgi:murein L,D-transpeptidase YcbB/YkuD